MLFGENFLPSVPRIKELHSPVKRLHLSRCLNGVLTAKLIKKKSADSIGRACNRRKQKHLYCLFSESRNTILRPSLFPDILSSKVGALGAGAGFAACFGSRADLSAPSTSCAQ